MIFDKYLRTLPTPASAGAGREQRAADHASDGGQTAGGHMGRVAAILTGKRARALAVALAIGTTVLTLSAPQAEARPRRDNGVRCSWTLDSGSIMFFLVGEYHTTGVGGGLYQCGSNGGWTQTGTYDNSGDYTPLPRSRRGGVDVR